MGHFAEVDGFDLLSEHSFLEFGAVVEVADIGHNGSCFVAVSCVKERIVPGAGYSFSFA